MEAAAASTTTMAHHCSPPPPSPLTGTANLCFSPFRSRCSSLRLPSRLSASAATSSSSDNDGEETARSSIHLKSKENALDISEQHRTEKGELNSSNDVMKLFNDVQQNMLFLNQQRVAAIDNLKKVERENKILLSRIHLLEAEVETSAAEREVLQRNLQALELETNKVYGNGRMKEDFGVTAALISIFSELLLRIDSMVLTGAMNSWQANLLKSLVVKRDARTAEIFSSFKSQSDSELASKLLPLLDPNRRYGMHITHICTEFSKIMECESLGTFVLNLSSSMQRRGNLVDVILPKYSILKMDEVQNLRDLQVDFLSYYCGRWHKNRISTGVVNGVGITLIEPLHPDGFFVRDHLYGYDDDFERFCYFCRAALEYILKSGKHPDILHLHNWQTALVAPMFWDLYVEQGLSRTRIFLSCNDFEKQCLEDPAKLSSCGLDPHSLHRPDRLQDEFNPKLVNILKGGIVYSNKIVTSGSLKDIMGLESTLATHKNKIFHICNGLDVHVWNPSSDSYLPSTYSSGDLSGKMTCKTYLKQKLGLPDSESSIPLISCVAVTVGESELELIKAISDSAIMRGSQLVLIGESILPSIQKSLEEFRVGLEEKGVRVCSKYDTSLAHLILAASDILVTVSRDEQILSAAMQYGTIPVTLQQPDHCNMITDADSMPPSGEANAFTYLSATAHELSQALNRAIDCKMNDSQKWNELIRNGMSRDFSWDGQCTDKYIAAYESIKVL